jgi:hypothetical protein
LSVAFFSAVLAENFLSKINSPAGFGGASGLTRLWEWSAFRILKKKFNIGVKTPQAISDYGLRIADWLVKIGCLADADCAEIAPRCRIKPGWWTPNHFERLPLI